MEFLDTYTNVFYILAVVFGSEVANNYIPGFTKIKSRWTALIVSVVMLAIFYLIENPANDGVYAQRTFVSFLISVALYDFIIKPIKNLFKKKFGGLNNLENPNLNNNESE